MPSFLPTRNRQQAPPFGTALCAVLLALLALVGHAKAGFSRNDEACSFRQAGKTYSFRWHEVLTGLRGSGSRSTDPLEKLLNEAAVRELKPEEVQQIRQYAEEYLRNLVLAEEAKLRGYDKMPEVWEAQDAIYARMAVRRYVSEVLVPRFQREVREEKLAALYEANIAHYRQPEKRSARYLFISRETAASQPGLFATIKRKVELAELTLAEAARRYSEQPSGRDGGYLESFARGTYPNAAFEAAVFDHPAGAPARELSNDKGLYLIETVEVSPAIEIPLKQAEPSLREAYVTSNMRKLLDEHLEARTKNLSFLTMAEVNAALAAGEDEKVIVGEGETAIVTVGHVARRRQAFRTVEPAAQTPDPRAPMTEIEYKTFLENALLRFDADRAGVTRSVEFIGEYHAMRLALLRGFTLKRAMPDADEPVTEEQALEYYRANLPAYADLAPVDAVSWTFGLDDSNASPDIATRAKALYDIEQKLRALVAASNAKEERLDRARVASLFAEHGLKPIAAPEEMKRVKGKGDGAGYFLNSALPGRLSEPYFDAKGERFSVLLLESRHDPEPIPFEQVKGGVVGLLQMMRDRARETAVWSKLGEQYHMQVVMP